MNNTSDLNYVYEMRKAFSHKHMITPSGELNHKYFLQKLGKYWSQDETELLYKGIEKYGVGQVEEIKENIEYDCFLSDRDKPLIDEIVEIMAEVLTMNTPYYTIEGKQYPVELVKQRFREVTNENLQSFLLEFNRHTEKIYNPKAYLITSLFNMPATADTVLTNMVKNDMAQGGF